MKPNYKHDCKKCKFLGGYIWGNEPYDLYVCVDLSNPLMTDLIVRSSDEDSDYCSTPVALLRTHDRFQRGTPMGETWCRAVEAGLALDPDGIIRHEQSAYLSEDMLNAGRLVEATSTLLHSTFIMSNNALMIAKRKLQSSVGGEDHERELKDAVVKYLEKVIEEQSESGESKAP